MRKTVFFLAGLLLASCTASAPIDRQAATFSSAMSSSVNTSWNQPPGPKLPSKREHIVPAFTNANDIWRGNFPVTGTGLKLLPDFLSKAGLPELASLSHFGGDKPFTSDLCASLVHKFNALSKTTLDITLCNKGVLQDGTFADGDPLVLSLSEFNGAYIILLVDEAKQNGVKLFSYQYTIFNKGFSIFDRNPIGDSIIYYGDSMLYFVTPKGKLTHTYDLRLQEMVKK